MADFKRRLKDLIGLGGNESVAYDDYADDDDDDYGTYYDSDTTEDYESDDTHIDASASSSNSARPVSSASSSSRASRTEGRTSSFGGTSAGTSDRSKVISMGAASNLKVVLSKPVEFSDCENVCSHLRGHMTVVLNLEFVRNIADKRRIFDFVSGCCFALDCNIQRVSELVYVIAPCDVDVFSEADDEDTSESFAF